MKKKDDTKRVFVCFWKDEARYMHRIASITIEGMSDASEEEVVAEVITTALNSASYARPDHGDIWVTEVEDMTRYEFSNAFDVRRA